MKTTGNRCRIFGGHGAVSVLDGKKLAVCGESNVYAAQKKNIDRYQRTYFFSRER